MKVKISKMISNQKLLVVGMIIFAALTRLIPHAPNFTSVGAMALFAGAMWGLSATTFIVPLAALVLTDLVLGMHSTIFYVYGAFLLISLIGALSLKKRTGARLVGVTLFSSLVFFFITNFGVWMADSLYAHNLAGLTECLVMGLPFLKNQILGDVTFSVLMFSAYELLARRFVVAKN